ncbi:MAG: hypothetical protein GKS03_11685 [Alphaproteobacteria bacterium]|nr:hypothetical protein [Alphaproteobacteria bacterium]
MIDSDRDMTRNTLAGVVFCSFVALFNANVGAQESASGIEPLSEPRLLEALPPPVSLVPDASRERVSRPGDSSMVPEGVISVRQLDALSSDSIGLLDGFTDGLPVDLWAGTSKELVDLLLPKLPRKVKSGATRDLAKRLLLSVARPPKPSLSEDVFVDMTAIVPSAIGFTPDSDVGSDASDADIDQVQMEGLALLESRLTQLAAMGDWTSVGAMIELVPDASMTDGIRILAADLALVDGRVEQVCLDASENLRFSNEPYWQKAFAFCQLRDGNVSSAFLTLDLLRETGIDDAAFFWVAELMAGNRPITPSGLTRLSPLQLAMLRHAGRPFPPQLVRNGDPTLLRVLATAEPLYVAAEDEAEDVVAERVRQGLDLRLEAAERAVELGALTPDILRALYRAEGVTDAENAKKLEQSPETVPMVDRQQNTDAAEVDLDLSSIPVATALDRARLFMLAEAQAIPTARAEVISRAIDFARNDRGRNAPDVAATGQVFAPLIMEIAPTGDLVWFAGNAARALIAAGEIDAGTTWLQLSQAYARTSIEASDVAAAMWPTERQLRPSMINRFTPLRFKRWEESRPPGLVAANKTLVLSTFAALGEAITSADWMSLMDRRSSSSVAMPSPQIWSGLALAAEEGRLGETVLLALIALDEVGPSGSSPIVLARVISALMTVGLEQDARRFAVEASLIQGL